MIQKRGGGGGGGENSPISPPMDPRLCRCTFLLLFLIFFFHSATMHNSITNLLITMYVSENVLSTGSHCMRVCAFVPPA